MSAEIDYSHVIVDSFANESSEFVKKKKKKKKKKKIGATTDMPDVIPEEPVETSKHQTPRDPS